MEWDFPIQRRVRSAAHLRHNLGTSSPPSAKQQQQYTNLLSSLSEHHQKYINMSPRLPDDILHMLCEELVEQRDFGTLFNCCCVGKSLAVPALAGLYRYSDPFKCELKLPKTNAIQESASFFHQNQRQRFEHIICRARVSGTKMVHSVAKYHLVRAGENSSSILSVPQGFRSW